ncbi:MAG: DUF1573 domain-containing protein [Verrucomicrobiota bacterium JB023]|nr:DUF1573 domain-containing protein [Verrucomicrobiota bacterium JB023]
MKWLNWVLGIGLCASLNAGELVFEELLIEHDAKPDEEKVDVDFKFTVEGEGPAVIKRYEAACSCLEARISEGGKLVWQPGESGTVRGVFSVGNFRGTLDKSISVQMADGRSHQLTVRMTMPELLKIEPKTLRWDEGAKPAPQSFTITVNADEPINIKGLSGTNNEKFPYELETVEEGKRYKVTVTPSNTEQRGFGLLRIATDSRYRKHQSYQAFMVVTKPRPQS